MLRVQPQITPNTIKTTHRRVTTPQLTAIPPRVNPHQSDMTSACNESRCKTIHTTVGLKKKRSANNLAQEQLNDETLLSSDERLASADEEPKSKCQKASNAITQLHLSNGDKDLETVLDQDLEMETDDDDQIKAALTSPLFNDLMTEIGLDIDADNTTHVNLQPSASSHKKYDSIIKDYKMRVESLHALLKRLEASRSYAALIRKYPKLATALAVPLIIALTLAAGNPLFFAVVCFSFTNSETVGDSASMLANLIKYWEYREKSTLSGSMGLTPRWYEKLIRRPEHNRYQRGLYNALHDGLHTQEGRQPLDGTWREALRAKRIALDTLLKQAEEFHNANEDSINRALNQQQDSEVMDKFVSQYLNPVMHEIELLYAIYNDKIEAGISSYSNKYKGATALSRRYEQDYLDAYFQTTLATAAKAGKAIRLFDQLHEINPSTRRSNYAHGVVTRASTLCRSLQVANERDPLLQQHPVPV